MRRDQKAPGCCEFLFEQLQGRGILLHYRCNQEALVSVIASKTSNSVDLQMVGSCSVIRLWTVSAACFFFFNSTLMLVSSTKGLYPTGYCCAAVKMTPYVMLFLPLVGNIYILKILSCQTAENATNG